MLNLNYDPGTGYKAQVYSYALHNNFSVNDGLHIQRWSHKIIIL